MRRGKEGSGVRSLTESQEDVSMYICTVGLQKNRMGVEDRPVYSLALSLSIDPVHGRSQDPKDKAIFVLKFFFLSFPLGLFQIPNGCDLPHVYAPLWPVSGGATEKNQRIGTFSDCKSQPCLSLCGLRTCISSLSTLVSSRVGLLMPPHKLWGWSSPACTPSMVVVVWSTFYLPYILDSNSKPHFASW